MTYLKYFRYLMVLEVVIGGSNLWAQEASNSDTQEEILGAEAPSSGAADELFSSERARYMNKLKSEVEPNLIRSDIQRLNKNVMRLGSYRSDWSKSAQEFLVANASLSELYLYRYTSVKNPRLTKAILETLLQIPAFREPAAVLAFFPAFKEWPDLAMQVLAKACEQDPKLIPEAIQALQGPLGGAVGLEDRLYFAVKVCPRIPSMALGSKEILKAWGQDAKEVWEKILAYELDPCLKGI